MADITFITKCTFDILVDEVSPPQVFVFSKESLISPLLASTEFNIVIHLTRFWGRPRPRGASGVAASDAAVGTAIGSICKNSLD